MNDLSCYMLLSENATNIIREIINIIRISAIVIVVFNALFSLLPAIVSKDKSGIKKSIGKIIMMIIVIIIVLLFPYILNMITQIFGYDIMCLF